MTNTQREHNIRSAMDLIREAQQLVDEALKDTNTESHYDMYGKYGMKQLLGNGNPMDGSLPKLIEEIENEELYSLHDDE